MISRPDGRPGPSLRDRNRAVLAERTGWPAGALLECQRLEAAHPGWEVSWFAEHTVKSAPELDRVAGFYAWRAGAQPGSNVYGLDGPRFKRRDEWYGETPAELEHQMLHGQPR